MRSPRAHFLGAALFLVFLVGGLRSAIAQSASNPVLLGEWPGFSRLGRQGNAPINEIVAEGNLLYVAAGETGLIVVDASDPSNLRRLGGHDTPGEGYGIAARGGIACVADGIAGLRIFDVSDPARPRFVAAFSGVGDARSVALDEHGNAYVMDYAAGLQIVSLANPASPVALGAVRGFSGGLFGNVVIVRAGFAYVGVDEGFFVVDVRRPEHPAIVGRLELGFGNAFRDIALHGNFAYAPDISGLHVIDVSDPENPRRVGSLLSGAAGGPEVVVAGNRGCFYTDSRRIVLFDLTNPTEPREVGVLGSDNPHLALSSSGETLYTEGLTSLRLMSAIIRPLHLIVSIFLVLRATLRSSATSPLWRMTGVACDSWMSLILLPSSNSQQLSWLRAPSLLRRSMT